MSEVSIVENLMQDIRFTLRTMFKNLGFTSVVILTLALGTGVNTAIFSLIDGILLQPLPYAEPDRLVKIGKSSLSKGNFLALRDRMQTMEVATIGLDTGFNLNTKGYSEYSERVNGNAVSSNFFSLLGVTPKLGRIFSAGDEVPGKDRLVLLSYDLWQTKFASDANIVGRSITLDDLDYQVIGVLNAGFSFPAASGVLWIPAEINITDVPGTWTFGHNVIGRLRSHATLKDAKAEFKTVFPQVLEGVPFPLPANFGADFDVNTLEEFSVSGIRTTLLALLGAVALILMVACLNVANLLLARSANRQKEIAIRAALGANRRRIFVQLLTESVVLGVVGGALGCILALFGIMGLKAVLPADTPRLATLGIDGRVLLYSGAISVLTGLIFGLAPALQLSKFDLEPALRSSGRGSGPSQKRKKISSILVVAEISMAVILVSGAGLLIKSLWVLNNLHTGFNEQHLLLADITPSNDFCKSSGSCTLFYSEVMHRVNTLPGVSSTAVTTTVPLEKFGGIPLTAEDRPESDATPYICWYFQVSPGYLNTMGISLLQGREFAETDTVKSPFVVLVSRSLAQFLWPGQDPIGKHVKPVKSPNWGTVVGLVDDVRHYKIAPASWAANVKGDVYFASTQLLPNTMSMVVRTAGDRKLLAGELQSAVASVSAMVPVSHIRTIEQVVSNSVSSPRSSMWLFTAFAVLALALGVVGIYSVISYTVTQRTREIGIRMAMGANKTKILHMVLQQGAILMLAGIAIGLVSALILVRMLASLFYGLHTSDPIIFGIVSLVVAAAAMTANYIPSRRATKVNPTVALKYE